ncbi:dihydroxyacetone kinase subunit L [Thalassospira sp. MA62]|nr:dihydroxyacetone kinase subunit L [Thalassospira sp. MA62]
MTVLSNAQIIQWINKTAEVISEKHVYLTELDTAIGDADHGNNMDRGFKAVITQLKTDETDIGAILKTVAMSLISKVGGAAGPLYGTMFLQASNVTKGKTELAAGDLSQLFKAAISGIEMRGKAKAGEKTILDTLIPAVDAYDAAIEAGDEIPAALDKMAEAAENGMKATIPLIATKGRASYLGERSKDHQDPGATSCFFMIKALRDTVCEG